MTFVSRQLVIGTFEASHVRLTRLDGKELVFGRGGIVDIGVIKNNCQAYKLHSEESGTGYVGSSLGGPPPSFRRRIDT